MTPPAAATVPGSGDAPPVLSEHERSVLGVVVYSCTVSSIRHAKDADRAPSMAERGEMLRMSAERVAALDGLGALAASVGADAAAAASAPSPSRAATRSALIRSICPRSAMDGALSASLA